MKFVMNDNRKFISCEIIIAKYNEDISWISQIPKHFKITVYNKSRTPIPNSTILPNLGREGATYAYHLYHNYGRHQAINIFCQGNPFEHCPNFIEKISSLQKLDNYYTFCGNRSFFRGIDWIVKHKKPEWGIQSPSAPWANHNPGFNEYWDYLFSTPYQNEFTFTPGAIFAVPSYLITYRSPDFYLKILDTVNHNINPVEGFYLELVWRYVFDPFVKVR